MITNPSVSVSSSVSVSLSNRVRNRKRISQKINGIILSSFISAISPSFEKCYSEISPFTKNQANFDYSFFKQLKQKKLSKGIR
jgi:hypothetical protein